MEFVQDITSVLDSLAETIAITSMCFNARKIAKSLLMNAVLCGSIQFAFLIPVSESANGDLQYCIIRADIYEVWIIELA